MMMGKIIETENFSESESICIPLGGNEYTIKTFADHDKKISEESSKLLKELLKLEKPLVEEAKEITIDQQIIEHWSDMTASNFLAKIGYKNNSIQYTECWNNYKSRKAMKNGISLLMVHSYLAIIHHNIPGRNDGIDLNHLSYTDDMDIFISNDNIFSKFKKYTNLKIFSLKEFLQFIKDSENYSSDTKNCDCTEAQQNMHPPA